MMARDACASLGLTPSTKLHYPARRFMFEMLTDLNTSAHPGDHLRRWLIDDRRFRLVMELGAWHGETTCGLFQQKEFRIDAQVTFGADRDWQHSVIAVDNWQPSDEWKSPLLTSPFNVPAVRLGIVPPPPPPPPPPSPPLPNNVTQHLARLRPHWQFLCNMQHAPTSQAPATADCPREPEKRIFPLRIDGELEGSHAMIALSKSPQRPELMYFNPPRPGSRFDSLRDLGYLWDEVLACNGTFAGHGLEDEVVKSAVFAFAHRRRLRVDMWWVHSPGAKFFFFLFFFHPVPWDAARPPPFRVVPFAVWAVRHKQNCST